MYQALTYTIGYGMLIRTCVIFYKDLDDYIKYRFRPLPYTLRRFFYSKTLPLCFLAGYLRYYFNEPIGDYLIKKYYCSC